MANKDLQFDPHRVTENKKVREDVWIYEDSEGLWVYFAGGEHGVMIKWPRIRAALKRKDK